MNLSTTGFDKKGGPIDPKSILRDRLDNEPLICAEGYLFEFERRGYLQAGAFVPEVVLEHPEVVLQLHREFLRAGSDMMVAFTYYAHREKLSVIGKEHLLEEMQKSALALARQAADEAQNSRILVAGNICNTNIYDGNDTATQVEVQRMFDEQVAWAAEAGVDFMIAETIAHHGEARLACIDSSSRHGSCGQSGGPSGGPAERRGFHTRQLQGARADGRHGGRDELQPGPGHHASPGRKRSASQSTAMWRRYPSLTVPPRRTRPSSPLRIRAAIVFPTTGPFPWHSIHLPATDMKWPRLLKKPLPPISASSGSAVVPGRIISAPLLRLWVENRQPADTQRICPSIMPWVPADERKKTISILPKGKSYSGPGGDG